MKIIDRKTGKRLDGLGRKEAAQVAKNDPIKRNVEKGLEEEEFSPMDPPDAYELQGDLKDANLDELAPELKEFMEEHKNSMEIVGKFEKALLAFKQNDFELNDEINAVFTAFFSFFEDAFLDHNRREEKQLFPLLHERLIAAGEHSNSKPIRTAIDLFEDDHIKFIQLGALCFNFLGLGVRLRDPHSKILVMDVAFNNGVELAELIKLHIWREDHTLFPLAQRHLTPEELTALCHH